MYRFVQTSRKQLSGFSLVEVLLAATIFGFLATALIGAIIYGQQSTANAGDRTQATMLAEEGIEAVRNIKNASYASLTNGTFGLVQNNDSWNLSGTSDINDIFTRQITIADNGTNRKRVTSKVSWTTGAHTRDTTVVTDFANWAEAIIPPTVSGPIMMAYTKTTTTPFYRIWDGDNWGAEATAQNVVGNINYIVLKSSNTRNEAILGIQTSTGAIYTQIWNGTSWGNLTQVGTGPTTTRSFDIAYEKTTGNAMIAYSSSADFAYRTWNGTTLSSATTVTAPPTTGAVNWIELDQNPVADSNDIAMIMLDANADIYGMRWTGSAWNNMGTGTVWDATGSTATRKGVDVEYEQNSGHIMFAWGDSTATDLQYRTWNGTTLSAATLLDVPAMAGVSNWVQMAGRPTSDEIMIGVQDASLNLNTRKWSGSAWDTETQHPEHDATVENATSRNFDLVWDTHASNPGKAWLMWGDGNTITARQWSGSAWGTTAVLAGSDDTSFIRLRTDTTGKVYAGIYESSASATDDIWETRITDGGTTWSAKNTIWAGPTSAEPVNFRIDIATP